MKDASDFKRYKIYENEKLITKAMNFLKYADPDHATREDAISYLEFMQTVAVEVAHTIPDSLEEYFEAYKSQHKNKD